MPRNTGGDRMAAASGGGPPRPPDDFFKNRTLQYQFIIKDLTTKVLRGIDKALGGLYKHIKDANKTLKTMFEKATKNLKTMTDSLKKSDDKIEHITKGIDKLAKATEKAQEGLKDTQDRLKEIGAASVLTSIAEAERSIKGIVPDEAEKGTESFTKNMVQISKLMGLSRDQAKTFRDEMVKVSEEFDNSVVHISYYGEVIEHLRKEGIRNTDEFKKLSPVLSQMGQLVGLSADKMAESGANLFKQLELSADEVGKVYQRFHQIQTVASLDAEEMNTFIQKYTDEIQVAYQGVDKVARSKVIENLMAMQGALRTQFTNINPQFMDDLTAALKGNQDAVKKVYVQTGLYGENLSELMTTQEGVSKVFQGLTGFIRQNVDAVKDQPMALQALAEAWHMDAQEMLRFSERSTEINASLSDVFTTINKEGRPAMEYAKDIFKSNSFAVERLSNWISNLAKYDLPLLGVSLLDISQVAMDVPWTTMFLGISALGHALEQSGKLTEKYGKAAEWMSGKWEVAATVAGDFKNMILATPAAIRKGIASLAAYTATLQGLTFAQTVAAAKTWIVATAESALLSIRAAGTATTAAATTATGAFAGATTWLAGTFTALWAALVPVLPLILTWVAVIGAVSAALYLLYKYWEPIKDMFWSSDVGKAVSESLIPALQSVYGVFSELAALVWENLKPAFMWMYEWVLKPTAMLVWWEMGLAVKALALSLTVLAKVLGAVIKIGVWAIGSFLSPFINGFRAIADMVTVVANALSGAIKMVRIFASVMRDIAGSAWMRVVEKLSSVATTVGGTYDSFKNWITGTPAATGPAPMSAMARAPEMAGGGLVNGPTTVVAGEAGPELITPLPDFKGLAASIAEATVRTLARAPAAAPITVTQDAVVQKLDELMELMTRLAPENRRRRPVAGFGYSDAVFNYSG